MVVLSLAGVALPAWAQSSASSEIGAWYIGIEGGLGVVNGFDPVIPGYGDDTGFNVGAAAALRSGAQVSPHMRLETELSWNGSSIESLSGRVDVLAWTQNLYYDFGEVDAFIRPYLGVGLGMGYGWLESNLPSAAPFLTNRSGVGFAYVVEGGGRFRLNDRFTLSAAWHFLGTAALIDDGIGGSISPTMHGFMLGLHTTL
jgi:hypothetical protein